MKFNIWIMGPCSVENKETYFEVAKHLSPLMVGKDWYMKGSFDKANRSSLHGDRGPGLESSIDIFKELKQEIPGIKLLTDVHECWQVEKLAGVIDCIQIPAFLQRQTDLIVECAKHFDKINIKKMQHLGPNNLIRSVDKIKEVNPNCEAWLCDRGSNYGYDHLIMDYTYVDELKKHYDKVLIDCTHGTQRSRAVHGLQGDRKLAERYFVTAPAFNYDGVFAECHPNPSCALSDGDCQLELDRVEELINVQNDIANAAKRLNDT